MNKISIVIPFYNESETIIRTLDSINNQSLHPDEVIFVDSGSNDNTEDLIKRWIRKEKKTNYKVIYSGKMSPSSSINLGIQKAKHCLIAYLDCGLAVPFNWLESSLDIINKYNCEMVSGKIYTEGSSYIDMSLVAQSYGYKNNTICLTGSLIKKEILKKLNYFLEECRASYDIDFINKFKKEKYVRKVNKDVIFKYYGINYSSNYFIALCKVFEYSKNGWEAYGDFKPIGYISLIIFIIFLPYNYYFYIFLLYFIIRGYLIPYYKSANFNFFKRIPLIFLLPISGFIFDIARLAGYIHSLPKVFINAK